MVTCPSRSPRSRPERGKGNGARTGVLERLSSRHEPAGAGAEGWARTCPGPARLAHGPGQQLARHPEWTWTRQCPQGGGIRAALWARAAWRAGVPRGRGEAVPPPTLRLQQGWPEHLRRVTPSLCPGSQGLRSRRRHHFTHREALRHPPSTLPAATEARCRGVLGLWVRCRSRRRHSPTAPGGREAGRPARALPSPAVSLEPRSPHL